MSLFTDINNYIELLSSDWVLTEDNENCYVLHLDNKDNFASIDIEFHQEMVVRNNKVKPFNWGNASLKAAGKLSYEDVEKIVRDLNEIIRKNT